MLTTTAGAASETKFNAVKSSTAANPFARLRPQLRSEEDEIRKGIFGRALRLLHTATAEEKQQWCGAIREATAAQQSSIRKRAEQKNNDNNNNINNNNNNNNNNNINRSNNDDVTVDSLFAPMKRPREEVGEEMMAKMGVKVEGEIAEENKMTEGEQCEKQGPADASNTGDSAGPAAAAEPQPTDTEFIAAYLRTLLDKVIGLSLMELHVSALQVLCVMLGVDLPKSKSKMSLYSNLASFHYTHCEKLGKRVSSSHNLEEQLKRDEQMIKKIFTKPTSAGKNKTVETTPTTTKLSAAAAAGTLQTNNATVNNTPANKDEKKSSHKKDEQRAAASATEKNISPLVDSAPRIGNYRPVTDAAVKVQKTKTSIRKEDKQKEEEKKFKPTRTEQEPGLEIQYHSRVFADATASHQAAPSARNEDGDSDGDNYEDEEEAEEWSRPSLERKVASVVQLCDPVTAAMVVKKLAQMGYNEPGAMETVEMILRSFHQRELVFYDNGIAYLL